MASKTKARKRIRFLRKAFERIAYLSLGVDIAIAAVTLLYVNTQSGNLLNLELLLNGVLTAIVVLSLIVFLGLLLLGYYLKYLEKRTGVSQRVL